MPPSTIMLTYSPRKKSPNRIPLYSVWYPAMSSFSASGRSKGILLLSAMALSRKTTKATGCTRTNGYDSWARTMSTMLKEPAIMTMGTRERPRESS
ncbi:MAG: hypothetical protein BWY88_01132 [Synergistetes bacterium ADurb.Bin520]|nr:MAG: hypothetical protein BWY88_01132 [Synergistetes bacterium ADurb.Bin520]